jgi:mannitol-1-phosphate 5-dehydrogenase
VDNIKAWVDRKAFIHNLGHVAAAYFGFFKYPERKYLFEVLENHEVHLFTREAMEQSAKALIAEYPDVFTEDDLHEHIQDLVNRFRNNALGDTIFRIGSDLKRKLSGGDRIIGAIKLAQKHNCPYNRLIEVLIYGLLFRAKDESGQLFEGDIDFAHDLELDIDNLLTSVCGFNKKTDIDDVLKIRYQYKFLLESNKQIKEK